MLEVCCLISLNHLSPAQPQATGNTLRKREREREGGRDMGRESCITSLQNRMQPFHDREKYSREGVRERELLCPCETASHAQTFHEREQEGKFRVGESEGKENDTAPAKPQAFQ